MIEETLLDNNDRSIEEVDKKFFGVMVATVINPVDLLMLGRIQVQLPAIDSMDLSPWARVAQPMAGILSGNYFIPNIGDQVYVIFEHGDLNAPVIIGSVWNTISRPPLPTPLPQIRTIRTLVGNQIVFTEAPPSVTIQTGPTPPSVSPAPPSPVGPYNTLMMSPAGVQIMSPTTILLQTGPATSILVSPAGIEIHAGGASLAITPAGIFVNGAMVNLAGGEVGIRGGMVRINS